MGCKGKRTNGNGSRKNKGGGSIFIKGTRGCLRPPLYSCADHNYGPGQSFRRKIPCIIVDSGNAQGCIISILGPAVLPMIHSVVNSSAQTIYILTPITRRILDKS